MSKNTKESEICPFPNLLSFIDEIDKDDDKLDPQLQNIIESLIDNSSKYSQKAYIASGGMKTISSVRDSSSLRNVAFAEIKGEYTDLQINSFYNEARITAQLEHPNIVPVYEISHEGGKPYFTMKEIHGQTLGTLLHQLADKEPIVTSEYSLNKLLDIFLKICDAIGYAHSKGIIHLDLKPDNIHVGEFGEVLVIDWGLSKNITDLSFENAEYISSQLDLQNTLDGYVKGTIGYMAPEQARGENSKKDKLTDIYSLGAILYSLLTYKAPYKDKNMEIALAKIATGEFTPFKEGLPETLKAVVYKAMALKKENRYQTVKELRKDIELYLQGFAPAALEADSTTLLRLFLKRNKLVIAMLFAFTSVIFITSLTFIFQLQEKEKISRNNAKTARANAVKAHTLYQNLIKANKDKKQLTEISVPFTSDLCKHFIHQMKFDDAYEALLKVSNQKIDDAVYWAYLGQLQLGFHDVQQARDSYQKALATSNNTRSKVINQFYLNLCLESEVNPPLDSIIRIITSINKEFTNHENIISHLCSTVYKSKEYTNNEKVNFLKETLMVLNPGLIESSITYNSQNNLLDFNGSKKLKNISPLTHFPVSTLILRNCTSLSDIRYIKANNLDKLDLSGLSSISLTPLNTLNLYYLALRNISIKKMNLSNSLLRYADFSHSTINLQELVKPKIEHLNLCQATIVGEKSSNFLRSLKSINIPSNYAFSEKQSQILKAKNVKLNLCNCKEENKCVFPKF
ncbi:MAG: serine/threonine protein kinase [Lentisphaeraceae bacterium]|nr:serine/threonine protein kinase [Lentisphaeraceae bacterium]